MSKCHLIITQWSKNKSVYELNHCFHLFECAVNSEWKQQSGAHIADVIKTPLFLVHLLPEVAWKKCMSNACKDFYRGFSVFFMCQDHINKWISVISFGTIYLSKSITELA